MYAFFFVFLYKWLFCIQNIQFVSIFFAICYNNIDKSVKVGDFSCLEKN